MKKRLPARRSALKTGPQRETEAYSLEPTASAFSAWASATASFDAAASPSAPSSAARLSQRRRVLAQTGGASFVVTLGIAWSLSSTYCYRAAYWTDTTTGSFSSRSTRLLEYITGRYAWACAFNKDSCKPRRRPALPPGTQGGWKGHSQRRLNLLRVRPGSGASTAPNSPIGKFGGLASGSRVAKSPQKVRSGSILPDWIC